MERDQPETPVAGAIERGRLRRTLTRAVAGVAVLAWSWWVAGLPAFSGVATAAVVGSGVAAALVGAAADRRWPRGRVAGERVAGGRPGRLRGWVLVGVVGGGWQLAAYLQHPRSDHPTISSLVNAALDSLPARTVAFALWLVVALELARR